MKEIKLDQVNNFSLHEHLLISKFGTKYQICQRKQTAIICRQSIYT